MLIALFRFFLSRAYSTIFSFSVSFSLFRLSRFCQPAREQSLLAGVSFDDSSLSPFRGFCYSLIQRTAEPVQKEDNAEFLYEPGRRSAQRYGLYARRWKLNALHEVFLFLPAFDRALHNLTGLGYESSSPCTIELILEVRNYTDKLLVSNNERETRGKFFFFLAFNG